MSPRTLASILLPVFVLTAQLASGEPAAYDPLAKVTEKLPAPLDPIVDDQVRDREIPVLIYLPTDSQPAPVVLFSHGLGGTRRGAVYLCDQWAGRGYAVICLQHPGSDDSVWRDATVGQRMAKMRQAAGLPNFLLRVADVRAVLDQLTKWNAAGDHPLAGRLDLERVGMSGHSFGAVTTQAVSGQKFRLRTEGFTDKRIKAAIAFSPSTPRNGDAATAFGSVTIPWLLMTGTKDVATIGGADVASRRAVFPALPAGSKYELVLDGAQHSAFTDRALPGEHERNPQHHQAIRAISTAFWDAYLRDDVSARQWLDGTGPRSVLDKLDVWQKK